MEDLRFETGRERNSEEPRYDRLAWAVVFFYLDSCVLRLFSFFILNLFCPVEAIRRGKFPGRERRFDILEHGIPLGWGAGFLHGHIPAELDDDGKRVDIDRAGFDAGIAGSAGIDLFLADIIAQERFAIFEALTASIQTFAHFLGTVADIHHDFAG